MAEFDPRSIGSKSFSREYWYYNGEPDKIYYKDVNLSGMAIDDPGHNMGWTIPPNHMGKKIIDLINRPSERKNMAKIIAVSHHVNKSSSGISIEGYPDSCLTVLHQFCSLLFSGAPWHYVDLAFTPQNSEHQPAVEDFEIDDRYWLLGAQVGYK